MVRTSSGRHENTVPQRLHGPNGRRGSAISSVDSMSPLRVPARPTTALRQPGPDGRHARRARARARCGNIVTARSMAEAAARTAYRATHWPFSQRAPGAHTVPQHRSAWRRSRGPRKRRSTPFGSPGTCTRRSRRRWRRGWRRRHRRPPRSSTRSCRRWRCPGYTELARTVGTPPASGTAITLPPTTSKFTSRCSLSRRRCRPRSPSRTRRRWPCRRRSAPSSRCGCRPAATARPVDVAAADRDVVAHAPLPHGERRGNSAGDGAFITAPSWILIPRFVQYTFSASMARAAGTPAPRRATRGPPARDTFVIAPSGAQGPGRPDTRRPSSSSNRRCASRRGRGGLPASSPAR